MVSSQSKQEMGGALLPSLHSFLAQSLLGNCRALEALRGSLSLPSDWLLRKKKMKKMNERSSRKRRKCYFDEIV